jgi:hypothetical protein
VKTAFGAKMLDTIAKRLKCCRAATGVSQHDVVNYIQSKGGDLSYVSYTRWESGSAVPVRKLELVDVVAEFFRDNGLHVEAQWILKGEGFPPQFAEYKNLDEDTLFIMASKTIEGVELIQVGGAYGDPFVSFGEFCIISNHNSIEENNNKLCYVRYKSGVKIGKVSILDESSIFIPGNEGLIIKKEDVLECRKIKWIQKK